MGLSPQSRRFRFLGSMNIPGDALLKQLTEIDPATEAAFVALTTDTVQQHEVGVARFSSQPDGAAEIAVAVDDHWQGKGLATLLMKRLIDVARERGIESLYSTDASDNYSMRDLASHLGFTCKSDPQDATQVIHSLNLRGH
jgi:GNAT superfamily N-acetyltransferase